MSPTIGGALGGPPPHGLARFTASGVTPPSSVDHSGLFPTVRDQGARETCVAFACCAATEKGFGKHLSPQHGYFLCKRTDGIPATRGTWLSVGAELINAGGFWEEIDWAYSPVQPLVEDGGPAPARSFSRYGAKAYEINPPGHVDLLKEALYLDYAVVATIEIYGSWLCIPSTPWNTGDLRAPLAGSTAIGRHAICLVGYDDSYKWNKGSGAFLFRNSWGTAFAQLGWRPGHGRLPYDFFRTPTHVTQAFAIK